MNTNSPAKSSPAITPGQSVPSRSQSAMRLDAAQPTTSTVATIERMPACMTNEMSFAVSLMTTCWTPQSAVSSTMRANAVESRGLRSVIGARFLP